MLDILFQRLPEVQCIVVVSPTAVSIGMQYLQQSGVLLAQLQHIQWIAVGKTTADCLAEYGIDALIPEVETSVNSAITEADNNPAAMAPTPVN